MRHDFSNTSAALPVHPTLRECGDEAASFEFLESLILDHGHLDVSELT
jgi:hypothetical protein